MGLREFSQFPAPPEGFVLRLKFIADVALILTADLRVVLLGVFAQLPVLRFCARQSFPGFFCGQGVLFGVGSRLSGDEHPGGGTLYAVPVCSEFVAFAPFFLPSGVAFYPGVVAQGKFAGLVVAAEF